MCGAAHERATRRNPTRAACIFAAKVNSNCSGEKMKQLALVLALTGSCVFAIRHRSTPAAALESYEAQMAASDAASRRAPTCSMPLGPSV